MDNTPRVLAGRYEVGELIGRGGMAEVHIGHDTRLGRTVAIKVLRSDLARDPSFLARFRREAQAAASLNHPAIVAVYDTGEDIHTDSQGGEVHVPFIVMEYIEGHTVRDILHDGAAVPIEEAVEITVGVLTALEYSHHAGIVHRDIKPANVMITPTGAVKVMDFGIARAVADSAATMTQTHAVIGTAQYLSPEQARGEQVDTRSDLYSTGCLLFELLTGRPPFQGDSPVAVAYQHVGQAPQRPSEIATDVPDVLDRITLLALTKDREQRYSTAAEFRSDLEAAMRGGHVAAPMLGAGAAGAAGAATTVMMGPASGQFPPYGGASATQVMAPMGQGAPTAWGAPVGPTTPGAGFPGPGGPGAREPQRQETDNKKTLLWTLIAVAATALVAILIFTLLNPEGGDTAEVPTVAAGLSVEDAQEIIERAEFTFASEVDPEASGEVGLTTGETNPEAGETAEVGSTIIVYTVGQPGEQTIPDLEGQSQDQARAALEALGFTVAGTVTPENHATIAKDLVTRTEPGKGQTVSTDTPVQLFVSSGQVTLPDLVGRSQAEAETELSNLNLNIRVEKEESDEEPGTVIRQEPVAGNVAQRSSVTIFVAEARQVETTNVPNVVGMNAAQAQETLNQNALNPVVRFEPSDEPLNNVIRQEPEAGSEVNEGSDVIIVVSLGPEDEPEPSPTPSGSGGGGGGGGNILP